MANKNVEVMRGNPETAVKKLAIPIMISMLLTASYNIIDGIWIAGLGQEAIAGIGFITPIFMILNGVSVSSTFFADFFNSFRSFNNCIVNSSGTLA